jgi:hypothetical protein
MGSAPEGCENSLMALPGPAHVGLFLFKRKGGDTLACSILELSNLFSGEDIASVLNICQT